MSLLGKVEKVLAVIEKAGVETVEAVSVIGGGAAAIGKAITGSQLSATGTTQLSDVIAKGEAVATAVTAAVAGGGVNWTIDTDAVQAVEAFVPTMIAFLKELKGGTPEAVTAAPAA